MKAFMAGDKSKVGAHDGWSRCGACSAMRGGNWRIPPESHLAPTARR